MTLTTTPYSQTADGADLLNELLVDARNEAKLTATKHLRKEHKRLAADRLRYPRQRAWDRIRLAAHHEELLARGVSVRPLPALPTEGRP